MKNTITIVKNTLTEFNNRPDKAKERIHELGDRAVEFTPTNKQKRKRIFKKDFRNL